MRGKAKDKMEDQSYFERAGLSGESQVNEPSITEIDSSPPVCNE